MRELVLENTVRDLKDKLDHWALLLAQDTKSPTAHNISEYMQQESHRLTIRLENLPK